MTEGRGPTLKFINHWRWRVMEAVFKLFSLILIR